MKIRVALLIAGMLGGPAVRADDQVPPPSSKLDQAKLALNTMREIQAAVMRKEDEAKSERDPVRLNCVHQNSARIAELITVGDHALEDMRVALSSGQPSEAVDAELEKIMLAKTKVEAVQKDADRCVGIKVVGADNGEGETIRDFTNLNTATDDPLTTLTSADSLPSIASHPPVASPTGQGQ